VLQRITAAAKCGVADLLDVCLEVRDACPDIPDSICGCDGHTHNNRCERQMASAQVDRVGECN
jgi:hypothetical protein